MRLLFVVLTILSVRNLKLFRFALFYLTHAAVLEFPLLFLQRKLADVDESMARAIRTRDSVEGMLEELAEGLLVMTDRWQNGLTGVRRAEKQMKKMEQDHNSEKQALRAKIERLEERLQREEDKAINLQKRIRV